LLKSKICVLLLSISCIPIFFSNLTFAALVTTSYDLWHDHQANGNRNAWFVEQGGAPWCRITCSKIVLWDILQKSVHGRRGVAGHIKWFNLMTFFGIEIPTVITSDYLISSVPNNAAPRRLIPSQPTNFDEKLMENVFIGGQARIDEKDFFDNLTLLDRCLLKQEILRFLDYSNLLCQCTGSKLIRKAFTKPAPEEPENEKALIKFFSMILSVPSLRCYLKMAWDNFGKISRNCQEVSYSRSKEAVNQEMKNICGISSRGVPVYEATLQASLNAIHDEIINNRMVIVKFESSVDKDADAHCCVAFAANNTEGTEGKEGLFLYNPWGNSFPVSIRNPEKTYNIANGLRKAPDICNISQYTIFNY
jgi:hypothetical protein